MSDEILLAVDYIYRFARPWGLCAAVYITASEHLVARACCADIYYVRPQHSSPPKKKVKIYLLIIKLGPVELEKNN